LEPIPKWRGAEDSVILLIAPPKKDELKGLGRMLEDEKKL